MEPDVVTFTAGMNDLLRPRFEREALLQALVDIVASCTERGARVLVVPIPDIRSVLPVSPVFESRRRELNGMYRYLAEHHGMLVPTVTTGSVFEDRRAWADDRLHLSALGHERLAVGAADLLGVPSDTDWLTPPDGPAPPHTLRGHEALPASRPSAHLGAARRRRRVGDLSRRAPWRHPGDGQLTAASPRRHRDDPRLLGAGARRGRPGHDPRGHPHREEQPVDDAGDQPAAGPARDRRPAHDERCMGPRRRAAHRDPGRLDRVMGQIRSVDGVVNSETSLLLRSAQL